MRAAADAYPPTRYRENQFGLAPHTMPTFLPSCRRPISKGSISGHKALDRKRLDQARAHPGSFVINAGDMCRRLDNDRFLSTQHLAINLTDQHRYSTPFFYTPHIDHKIACLPTCVGDRQPPPAIRDYLWRVPRCVAQHQLRR